MNNEELLESARLDRQTAAAKDAWAKDNSTKIELYMFRQDKWELCDYPGWCPGCHYRIAPTPLPRYEPWTLETAPPCGTVLQSKCAGGKYMIIGVIETGLVIGLAWHSYKQVLDLWLQLDGTTAGRRVDA